MNNYWHIQMNQPWGRGEVKIDSKLMLLSAPPIIGTGEWNNLQCEDFKGDNERGIKIDDIILVREGSNPIAICKIESDFFRDNNLTENFKHILYREVKVLEFFENNAKADLLLKTNLDKFKVSYIQASGTLTKCVGNNATNNFIKEWYQQYLENSEMKEKINLLKYKKQIILQGPPGTGKTKLAKDIAKDIIGLSNVSELENNECFKIIQFHPSYTYEDFVRGITAKSDENGVSYDTVDKTLATLAKKAHSNLIASQKEVSEYSKEVKVRNLLIEFSELVRDKIDNGQDYKITEKISITDVEEDAFRYGGNWKKGLRMKYDDLATAFLNNIESRQDLKNSESVSGSAKQHATYFFNVLEKFKKEFSDKLDNIDDSVVDKPKLQNYVLIIDEINRANLSSVLGELIYALEYRGKSVESMYEVDGNQSLVIPENLYIIGTMNTADRSVGHIDYAIRRRFAFVDILPKKLQENDEIYFNEIGFEKITEFIKKHISKEFEVEDVQIGHSYFIAKKSEANNEQERDEIFKMKMKYEVIPILEEYVKDGILIGDFDNKPIEEYIISSLKS